MTVEVPCPVPGPGVVHGADESLLALQPSDIVPPGQDLEVVRTGGHGLRHAHAVPHPREPVNSAEDEAAGDGDQWPRTRATVPH